MIDPGNLKRVTKRIVQRLTGMLMLMKEPSRLIPKMMTKAIVKDLKSHLRKAFICITH